MSTSNHNSAFEKNICCPICNSLCSQPPLNSYNSAQAAEHFCPIERKPDRYQRMKNCIEDLWGSTVSYFIRCDSCGFGFGYPYIGGNEIFYSIMHESRGYPQWKWDYTCALENLFQYNNTTIDIMDVGAGEGLFLEKLTANWNKYAVEGSPVTREILKNKNISVISWEEMDAIENKFEIITIFQVLEHISDFKMLLSKLYKMLKKNGQLIITVPSCEAMILQERILGCPDMPPNHINKFTPNSLQKYLKELGFKVSHPKTEPFSFRNITNALHLKIIHLSKVNTFFRFFYGITNRKLRHICLFFISGIVFFQILPNIKKITTGGSFLLTATK